MQAVGAAMSLSGSIGFEMMDSSLCNGCTESTPYSSESSFLFVYATSLLGAPSRTFGSSHPSHLVAIGLYSFHLATVWAAT